MIYIFIIIIIILLIFIYYKQNEHFNNIKVAPYTDNIKNRILFILWMGGELSENRKESIESIKKNTKCNVVFITKENLNKYILNDYPLHKGFKYLSAIHQADYLRCYLMHHYGGGYSDIKKAISSWEPSFKKIENNKNIWAVGLRGPKNFGIAYPLEYNKTQNKELKKNHKNLSGVSYFIYKPNTPLTQEWYNNLNKRLDYYYENLKKNPATFPRQAYGVSPSKYINNPKDVKIKLTKYPISWNRILGQINYPLQLKYLKHIEYGVPKPDLSKPYL